MTLGWLVVGFFVTLVALGMAEVASSYPTAGGLYYWAAKLAPESGRDPAKWSWFVGWFNLVGQVAVTAGIDFGLACFTTALLNLDVRLPGQPAEHDRGLRRRADPARAPEHVRDPAGRAAQRRVGVVARRRRRGDRHRLRLPQPAHPHRPRHRVLEDGQQHRVQLGHGSRAGRPGHPAVRGPHRPAERAVHADRLRRLGAHVGGDPRRRHRRTARHRVLGRRSR